MTADNQERFKQHPVFRPTDPNERITQIDILRGFALFGVLLVNAFGYNASFFDFSGFYHTFTDPLNSKIFEWLVGFAADKFIFIFSFLFGVGFGIMYLKYRADEKHFFWLYFRRMLALMVFGLLHILFFWAGDILFSYALMGFLLLFVRKWPSGRLLFLSIFFYFFPILYLALENVFPFLPDALSSVTNLKMPEVIAVYSGGSYAEIFKLRLHEYAAFRNINLIYYAPKVLSLFLLGYLFYKYNFLGRINRNRSKYALVAVLLLLSGVILTLYSDNVVNVLIAQENPYSLTVYMGVYEVTNILLGLSYILVILLLSQASFFRRLLDPLKYIGRTALTNYLMQSVIFTTLMYGYGFGRFGSYTPWQLLIWTFGVFTLQVLISGLWLKKYRFGPLEWLWRKFTYMDF